MPILTAMFAPQAAIALAVAGVSLIGLASLGALAARSGGASAWVGVLRVTFWGAVEVAATAGIGALFGTVAA